jgi:hypothetical protein
MDSRNLLSKISIFSAMGAFILSTCDKLLVQNNPPKDTKISGSGLFVSGLF